MSNSLWLTELRKEIEMAKTSGGVRGGSVKVFREMLVLYLVI